jgi:hypothetical protein
MNSIVRFYSFAIHLAIFLALVGQLKGCTLMMMEKAAGKTERGIISYSKYTRMLTR